MLLPELINQLTITNLISNLSSTFVFATIILNNIIFGYILMTDCFLKSTEPDPLENIK